MPRFSTKKRRGFHGKKKWEISREESKSEVQGSESVSDVIVKFDSKQVLYLIAEGINDN